MRNIFEGQLAFYFFLEKVDIDQLLITMNGYGPVIILHWSPSNFILITIWRVIFKVFTDYNLKSDFQPVITRFCDQVVQQFPFLGPAHSRT